MSSKATPSPLILYFFPQVVRERIKSFPINDAPAFCLPYLKAMPAKQMAAMVEEDLEGKEFASSATIELFEDGAISFLEEVKVKNGDVEENMVIKQPENTTESFITSTHSDQGNMIDFDESRKSELLVEEVIEDANAESAAGKIMAKDVVMVDNVAKDTDVAQELASPYAVLKDLDSILDGLKSKEAIVVKEESESAELNRDSTKTVMDKLWQLEDEEDDEDHSEKEGEGLNVKDIFNQYEKERYDMVDNIRSDNIAHKEVDKLDPLSYIKESVQKQEINNKEFEYQVCFKCNFKTLTANTFLLHTQSKHKGERIDLLKKCKSCDFTSSYSSTLRRHFRSIHIDGKNPVWKIRRGLVEGGEQRRRRKCYKCSFITSSRTNHRHHIKYAHTERELKLKKDGERWIKLTNKTQEEQMSEDELQGDEHVKDVDFPEITNRNHEELKPLVKTKYGVKKVDDEVYKHQHNILRFGCNLCPKKYNAHVEIEQHMKYDHEDSQVDPLIQIQFEKEKQELEDQKTEVINLERPTTEPRKMRRYQDCDYKTRSKGNLWQHIQYVHTKETNLLVPRPNITTVFPSRILQQCSGCDYSTNRPYLLRRHFKSIHVEGKHPVWKMRRNTIALKAATKSRVASNLTPESTVTSQEKSEPTDN